MNQAALTQPPNTPVVSIIMPAFNRATLIGESINSVLNQNFSHWELIIVDDGSSDGTVSIVESFQQEETRILLVKKLAGEQRGAAASRNMGMRLAKGSYLLFLDSDDVLLEHCLSQRLATALERTHDFYVFQGATFAEKIDQPVCYWNVRSVKSDPERFIAFDGPWSVSGGLWNLDFLQKHQIEWDEALQIWQDVDFHLQVLLRHPNYEVYWECPLDYLVRTDANNSISRVGYYAGNKVASRLHFWNKWVQQLGVDNFLKPFQYRTLLLIILTTFVKKRQWADAQATLSTAVEHSILTATEALQIKMNILITKLSFNRFPFPHKTFYSLPKDKPTLQSVAI